MTSRKIERRRHHAFWEFEQYIRPASVSFSFAQEKFSDNVCRASTRRHPAYFSLYTSVVVALMSLFFVNRQN
mgnify:CR=1 FL=1